ncbi:MAG: AAA family ATPase [Prevotella sp.]|nr:AAA family ATPase [Prevotella sp.]
MLINKIILNNYRLYEGENTISFNFDESRNIYLVCGENGFGKTTFLHSLLWCLYGRFVGDIPVSGQDAGNYTATLKGNLNLSAARRYEELATPDAIAAIKKSGYTGYEEIQKDSICSVTICFTEVGIPSIPCRNISVKRSYDALLQKEDVEILIDGNRNELTDEIGPDVFINDFILNKDIASLFFFDSEEIVSLAETSTIAERRKLSQAYEEVLGIRKYVELKTNLESLRLRYRKKSKDLSLRDKLESLEAERDAKRQEAQNLESTIEQMQGSMDALREENEQLQTKLSREGSSVKTEELQRVKAVIEHCKQEDTRMKNAIKQFIDYAPFAVAGNVFTQAYQLAKTDHNTTAINNAAVAQNSVLDALSSDMLQLLTSMPLKQKETEEAQKKLENIIAKYRGGTSNREIRLNISDEDFAEIEAVYNSLTTTYKLEFSTLAEAYRKNRITLERNARRLANIQSKESDEVVKALRDKKNEIEQKIKDTDEQLRQNHVKTGELKLTLDSLNKQIKELSRKVSVDDADEEKDKVASELIGELDTFLFSLKETKKSSLELRIRNALNTLMHKEDFIGRVEVELEDDSMDIKLYSPDGFEIDKSLLSKGEKQLYATSILKALVDESGIQFPVFIDSPLQKFDKSHASKIIIEFYPSISKQVILFPLLHKELTATEYDMLKPYVENAVVISNDTVRSTFKKVNTDKLMN